MPYIKYFIFGLMLPLGFAPFHMPGMAVLGLILFYTGLNARIDSSFWAGLFLGLGFFGLGTSWVYVSIHEYGHLHSFLAGLVTLFFLFYLAIFPALTGLCFSLFKKIKPFSLSSAFLFAALWILSEFARGSIFTGFPWLLTGYSQMDTPSRFLFPLVGVYGTGFFICLAAAFAANGLNARGSKRISYFIAFVLMILSPAGLKSLQGTDIASSGISTAVIQPNLSMRDKWDEALFWQLLDYYEHTSSALMGRDLIVWPESAVPLPVSYVSDYLERLNREAKQKGSALLLGIPLTTGNDEEYFNALMSFGKAKGIHRKEHLVPFGEYIPQPFAGLIKWLEIPDANLKPGVRGQGLIRVKNHPIASLVCYETAYPEILREQLPEGEWIVSVSDDGWFGHSFAMYQQQQMAQVLSIQTGRYQLTANNDGLSSVISDQGEILASLPAFTAGVLQSQIYPAYGETPWVRYGDFPVLMFSLLNILFFLMYHGFPQELLKQAIAAGSKRRYPYQPD